jgi:NAD(P)-dependent dehydrogenase (short-subunit alcohol dehydrogenase family)
LSLPRSDRAIARCLASRGSLVCINDVAANKAGIGQLVDELNSLTDGSAVSVVADGTKSSEIQSMIDQTVSELGSLTDMVANAGITQLEEVLEIGERRCLGSVFWC